MTMTAPPNVPGSRRVLPRVPSPHQVDRIRELVHQSTHWVLRGDWERYLAGEDAIGTVPIDELRRDQRIAAASWVSQQRHALHATLEGDRTAPEGWLEGLPLYKALTADLG